MKKDQNTGFLFPEMKPDDKVLRDEINLATLPLASFPGKRTVKGNQYEMTLQLDEFSSVKLISSPAGGGIPEGHDLDYLYALVEILYEQTKFQGDEIYFPLSQLITKAERTLCKGEYDRALTAIRRYRHLIIQSNMMQTTDEKGRATYTEEDISYIQHFTIVGDKLRTGRRKYTEALNGYCKIVFSKYFMQNIVSKELSKPLNYSLMLRISSPKGKKLFRMIDTYRYRESIRDDKGTEIVVKDLMYLAKRIPLTGNEMSKISWIKRSLDPIHDELKELKYLSDYFYRKTATGVEIVYCFSGFTTDEASAYNDLIKWGVIASVAGRLVKTHTPEKISDVIRYCEYKKEEKNIAPGYIVSTVENSDHASIKQFLDKKLEEEKKKRLNNDLKIREKLKSLYEVYIESAITEKMESLSDGDRDNLFSLARAEYKQSGYKHAGEKIVAEALEGIVRSMLKKSIRVLPFEKWYEQNKDKYQHIF